MVGTAGKILIGVGIGIAVVIGIFVALFVVAVDIFMEVTEDINEQAEEWDLIKDRLSSYPESIAFTALYPDSMEELISIIPPNYRYELRAIEDGSVFETDSLIIEYNAETGESNITYLCTEPDGDRTTYGGGDLAEVMADVCG